MRIHTYIVTYNEEDILPYVLKYYLQFSEKIYVLDNMSEDKTVKIAETSPRTEVISFDSQGELNNLMRVNFRADTAWKLSQDIENPPDWIINVDCDELVYHPDLSGILNRYLEEGVTLPRIYGINMASKDGIKNKDLIASFKFGTRARPYDKTAVYHSSLRIKMAPGSHFNYGNPNLIDTIRQRNFKPSPTKEICMLHYKWIGKRALKRAAISRKRRGAIDLKYNFGFHYMVPDKNILHAQKAILKKAIPILNDKNQILWEGIRENQINDYRVRYGAKINYKLLKQNPIVILTNLEPDILKVIIATKQEAAHIQIYYFDTIYHTFELVMESTQILVAADSFVQQNNMIKKIDKHFDRQALPLLSYPEKNNS
jgi:hypothetical protein